MSEEYLVQEHKKPGFETIAREWLDTIKRTRKPSTYDKYLMEYNEFISPYVVGISYGDMTTNVLKNIFRLKIEPNLADYSYSIASSVKTIFNQISYYGNEAYELDIDRVKVKFPKCFQTTVEVFSQREQKALVRYLNTDMDESKLGIYLCLSTGIRLGEICALKWEDIDLDCCIMSINRTVHRINAYNGKSKTKLSVGSPKSRSSRRDIPLSDELTAMMNDRKNCGSYVLGTSKPMDPRTYEYRFQKILNNLQIKHKKFHTLRHTFATNCIISGVDVKSLSEILGHSSVQVTLNRYVHPSMEQKRKYLNELQSKYRDFL